MALDRLERTPREVGAALTFEGLGVARIGSEARIEVVQHTGAHTQLSWSKPPDLLSYWS